MLFFPSISSGPIDRSRRFLQDLNNIPSRQDYLTLAGEGVFKILLGLIYKLILASIFFKGMGMVQGAREWYFVIFYAYCYGFTCFSTLPDTALWPLVPVIFWESGRLRTSENHF